MDAEVRRARVTRHVQQFGAVLERNGCDALDRVNVGLSLIHEVKTMLEEAGMPDAWDEIKPTVLGRLL